MNTNVLVHSETQGDPPSTEYEVFSFGPYRLCSAQRLLERSGHPIKLGGRAFDILMLLVRHAGEVVTHRQIHATVWAGLIVDGGSIRFHMSALRKALGGAELSCEYIVNIPGRGYSFVAPVIRLPSVTPAAERKRDTSPTATAHNLPPVLERMVGRQEAIRDIGSKLLTERFVTIVGPGGIGKTTVAIGIGHSFFAQFPGPVKFVDLASVREPSQVAAAIAIAIGLQIRTEDPAPSILAALRTCQMLLVLDSCEHVLDEASPLVEQIFASAAEVFILATSREPLGAEGEHVFRLQPLRIPAEGAIVTAQELAEYSALELFLERVQAGGSRIALNDADVETVIAICRRLDGMALAIELAASRVQAYGLRKTADLLGHQFSLLWPGRRTALPRHQTLMATLDWSYNLLSPVERRLLYRLSVFIGAFDLEGVMAVTQASTDFFEPEDNADLSSLVAKSLVVAESFGERTRYRLLDTTRNYGLGKLAESGEWEEANRQHARYYERVLMRYAQIEQGTGEWPRALASNLNDIRAAMSWALSEDGDVSLGVRLAAYSTSLWLGLGLLPECRDRMKQAASVADHSEATIEEKMLIQMALGATVMFTVGLGEAFRTSWTSVLSLAEEIDDKRNQLNAYLALWAQQIRALNTDEALLLARRCDAVARQFGKAGPKAMALWMLGLCEHHSGRYESARRHLEDALLSEDDADRILQLRHFGYDRRVDALGVLSNTFWMLGRTADALETSAMAVAEARQLDYPIPLCIALSWHCFNLYVIGAEWSEVERHAVTLIEHARHHGIEAYQGLGICLQALSGKPESDAEETASTVANGIKLLVRGRYTAFNPIFQADAALMLAEAGLRIHAETLFATMLKEDRNPDHWCSPEIVRIKGQLALSRGHNQEAENCFKLSIDSAARHGSLAWRLRSANSLAALWINEGRQDLVFDLLSPLVALFKKGIVSRDLQRARALLKSLTLASSSSPADSPNTHCIGEN